MKTKPLRPLDYELPRAPKEVMDAWMPRLQAVAVVTVLFAGVESTLLGTLPPRTSNPPATDTVLRFFAYSGLIFNIGATLSAVLLIIAMASLPAAARQVYVSCGHGYPRKIFQTNNGPHVTELNQLYLEGDGETSLLRAFGVAKGWGLMLRHCILCFVAGCCCAYLHIGISLWVLESKLVAAIVMPCVFIGFFPPLAVFFFGMKSSACSHCREERREIDV